MASIFTRIVNGEIPAAKVYEDDLTLAFLDINPAARGHTLVICKPELATLLDLTPELLVAVSHTVQRVARAIVDTLAPDGLNVIQNNWAAAGQVVHHYHVHLIPRWEGDHAVRHWRPGTSTSEELRDLSALISARIAEGGAA